MLAGGAGADRFVFSTIDDSLYGANADRISDFSHAQGDKIDLSAIDANTGARGGQAFTLIGSGLYTHQAGELRFAFTSLGITTVAGDVNGDGVSTSTSSSPATWPSSPATSCCSGDVSSSSSRHVRQTKSGPMSCPLAVDRG